MTGSQPIRRALHTRAGKLILIIWGAAMIVGVLVLIQIPFFSSWDFRHGLWAPSWLLVHGLNPYGLGAPGQNVRAVWLPMAIGLFFPLGWLNQYSATNVWLLCNIVFLIVAVFIVGGAGRLSRPFFVARLLAVFLFIPTISHFVLGQFSILILLLYLLSAKLVARRLILPAALLVALALTKPQLSLLVLPGLAIALWRAGGVKTMLSFGGALCVSMIWLALPLWIVYPGWIRDLLDITQSTPTFLQPSLYVLFRLHMGSLGLWVWLALALALFAFNAWLWWTRAPQEAVVWSLALTTLASPYVWNWDFVLVLPLVVYALAHYRALMARLVLGIGYTTCWGLAIWTMMTTDNGQEHYWWVPVLAIASICGGLLVNLVYSRSARLQIHMESGPC